jgi:rubredoxin
MKEIVLRYRCPNCEKEYEFKTNDLPAGSISPNHLGTIKLLVADCETPGCGFTKMFTDEEIKRALAHPEPKPPKGTWKVYWG